MPDYPVYYVEDLPKGCQQPGCTCVDSKLYFHGRCHPASQTWTFVEGDVLTVECGVCRKPIVKLKLAHRPKERKTRCRPS